MIMNAQEHINQRLEYLRGELQDECISYEELAELQSLAEFIQPGDVELLEAAGVPEEEASRNYTPQYYCFSEKCGYHIGSHEKLQSHFEAKHHWTHVQARKKASNTPVSYRPRRAA